MSSFCRLILIIVLLHTSFSRPRKPTTAWRFGVEPTKIKPLDVMTLLELLGEGGLSPEYMKINTPNTTDDFKGVSRNQGQACQSKEIIEDLNLTGDQYFPRFVKNVICVDSGNTCKPSDGSYSCVKTTIVKHVLKRDNREVLEYVSDTGKIEYFDYWRRDDLDIGVGCECSNGL